MRFLASFSMFLSALTFGAGAVAGTNTSSPVPYPAYPPYQPYATLCPSTTLDVCGIQISPAAGVVGNVQTFPLPERFVARQVAVQCMSEGINAFYKVTEGSALLCALKSCKPGNVSICGVSIPIAQETPLGEAVRLSVPPDYFGSTVVNPPAIYAQCHFSDGAMEYDVKDEYTVPCSIFACRPVTLSACNTTVAIPGPSDLGSIVQATTTDRRPVAVQCLSLSGGAPQYKVIDCNGVGE